MQISIFNLTPRFIIGSAYLRKRVSTIAAFTLFFFFLLSLILQTELASYKFLLSWACFGLHEEYNKFSLLTSYNFGFNTAHFRPCVPRR